MGADHQVSLPAGPASSSTGSKGNPQSPRYSTFLSEGLRGKDIHTLFGFFLLYTFFFSLYTPTTFVRLDRNYSVVIFYFLSE